MGDADQHTKVGVQLFLKRGAWQAWLLATSGFKPLLDGLAHLGDMPVPPIVQGRLSLCAELVEPAVGRRSTDADSCTTSGFLPARSFLHQHHHLLFGRLALLTFHNAFLFDSWFCFSLLSILAEEVVLVYMGSLVFA
jgi:hypothetical protein